MPVIFVGHRKLEDAEKNHEANITDQSLMLVDQKPLTGVGGLIYATVSFPLGRPAKKRLWLRQSRVSFLGVQLPKSGLVGS